MADKFVPTDFNIDNINGGNRFQNGDSVHADDLNRTIEGAYASWEKANTALDEAHIAVLTANDARTISTEVYSLGVNQPNVENAGNVGTPSVTIETLSDGTKRFVFENLKGEPSPPDNVVKARASLREALLEPRINDSSIPNYSIPQNEIRNLYGSVFEAVKERDILLYDKRKLYYVTGVVEYTDGSDPTIICELIFEFKEYVTPEESGTQLYQHKIDIGGPFLFIISDEKDAYTQLQDVVDAIHNREQYFISDDGLELLYYAHRISVSTDYAENVVAVGISHITNGAVTVYIHHMASDGSLTKSDWSWSPTVISDSVTKL